jgi:hypothetical protein
VTTFSASLINLTVLLAQTHYCSGYVSRRILAPPPLWLRKHTDLRAQDFAHSRVMWHHPKLATITCAGSWWLYGINLPRRISDLGTIWKQAVNFTTPTVLFLIEKAFGTCWIESWWVQDPDCMPCRRGRYCTCWNSNPISSVVEPVVQAFTLLS